jgi:hypothetical protein
MNVTKLLQLIVSFLKVT